MRNFDNFTHSFHMRASKLTKNLFFNGLYNSMRNDFLAVFLSVLSQEIKITLRRTFLIRYANQIKNYKIMELTNDQKNSHSPEGKKSSAVEKTDKSTSLNNTPVKPIDDMELNEEQLDIISGGGDPFAGPKG